MTDQMGQTGMPPPPQPSAGVGTVKRRSPGAIYLVETLVLLIGLLTILGGILSFGETSAVKSVLSIVLGVLLVVVAWGLSKRTRWAFYTTLLLVVGSAIADLFPSPDWFSIGISVLILGLLWKNREYFLNQPVIRPDSPIGAGNDTSKEKLRTFVIVSILLLGLVISLTTLAVSACREGELAVLKAAFYSLASIILFLGSIFYLIRMGKRWKVAYVILGVLTLVIAAQFLYPTFYPCS